ncbi:hypothetical protein YPPY89_2389, partial [Yersinia pestis PY-89]
MSICYEK